jgi:hypothetical protein
VIEHKKIVTIGTESFFVTTWTDGTVYVQTYVEQNGTIEIGPTCSAARQRLDSLLSEAMTGGTQAVDAFEQ